MAKEDRATENKPDSFDIDELEQMVEREVLETNKTLQEYNLTIEKTLSLIDEFYNKIKKGDN